MYEAILSPGLKEASKKAHTIPAVKKVLDAIDNFTVRQAVRLRAVIVSDTLMR